MRIRQLLPVCFLLAPMLAQAEVYFTIVQGLDGNPQYQSEFDEQRLQVTIASRTLAGEDRVSVFAGEDATRVALLEHFAALQKNMGADDRAVIYLIGHGSFDGFDYKFNLPGPDIDGADIKKILADLPGRNHFMLNTSSTSGAMLEVIAGDAKSTDTGGNILITATRNGVERNATHFGKYFAEALTDSAADLNKNNNVSIQEAFDFAAHNVEAWFEEGGRLATEHPQLRGEGAAQFSLARLDDSPLETGNPQTERLQQQRLALEAEIEELQLRRSEMSNAEYIEKLQALILQSAAVSEQIDAAQAGAEGATE